MNNPILFENLRVIRDFPKPGIMFQDISTLFSSKECLKIMTDEVVELYKDKGITKIVGLESRGFLLASSIAYHLGAGVIMARKPHKLPGNVISQSYEKEYGTDEICMIKDGIDNDDVVLIHDDLLATGGTLHATYELVKRFHPKKIYINTILELRIEGLNGRKIIENDAEYTTLMVVED